MRSDALDTGLVCVFEDVERSNRNWLQGKPDRCSDTQFFGPWENRHGVLIHTQRASCFRPEAEVRIGRDNVRTVFYEMDRRDVVGHEGPPPVRVEGSSEGGLSDGG